MTVPDYGPYQIHPILDCFPLMEGIEFDLLVANISEHGLFQSIRLTYDQGTIVDGRNRYLACIAARVDPNFRAVPSAWSELSIARYILSANLYRRGALPPERESALWGVAALLAEGTRMEKTTHARYAMAQEVRRRPPGAA